MKLPLNKDQRESVLPTIFVIAVTILMLAAVYYFKHIWSAFSTVMRLLTPFFIGFGISFLLNPLRTFLVNFFEKIVFGKCKKPHPKLARIFSAVIALILLYGCVALFLNFVLPQLYKSVESIYRYVSLFIARNESKINELLVKFDFLKITEGSLSVEWKNILSSQFKNITTVLGTLIDVSGSAVNFLYQLLVGTITAFYLLVDKEMLMARLKKVTYANCRKARGDALVYWAREANRLFSGFISGKILDSLIIGTICYVFMAVIGWPYPVLIACIIGVTNIIPFFGPFIGWVPGVLIMLIDKPINALWFSIFILVLQQIDGNIIGPRILGDSVGVSALSIMISIIVGSGLFGFVGMLLAVPVYALLYAFVKARVYTRLERKGLSTHTRDYVGTAPVIPKEEPEKEGDA